MKNETQMGTPTSGQKIISLSKTYPDSVASYIFKVAWWGNFDSLTQEQEAQIIVSYQRGYHPRRTAKEIQETL